MSKFYAETTQHLNTCIRASQLFCAHVEQCFILWVWSEPVNHYHCYYYYFTDSPLRALGKSFCCFMVWHDSRLILLKPDEGLNLSFDLNWLNRLLVREPRSTVDNQPRENVTVTLNYTSVVLFSSSCTWLRIVMHNPLRFYFDTTTNMPFLCSLVWNNSTHDKQDTDTR